MLILHLKFQKAEKALKYYKGCDGSTVAKSAALFKELDRLKTLASQRQADKKWHFRDFCEESFDLNNSQN